MTIATARRLRVASDLRSIRAVDGEAMVEAIRAFVTHKGRALRVRPVGLDELPFEAWDHGAALRLHCAPAEVQDFVVFGPSNAASAMVGWLFGYDDPCDLPRKAVEDALGETLNQVVGRLKNAIVHTAEFQPWLETPELLGYTPSMLASRVDPEAKAFIVSSDAWSGQMVFVCSPSRPRSVAAFEGALRVLMRFGSDREAMARVCRMLEEIRATNLAPRGAPRELKVRLSWCIETLAALLGSSAAERRDVLFHRVVQELDGLRVTLLGLCTPPSAIPFQLPVDTHVRGLLAEFCERARREIEDAERAISTRASDVVHRLFRSVRRIAADAAFLGLEQVDALAYETQTLLASVRDDGATLDESALEAVRTSLELVEDWVDELDEALQGGVCVEWSASIDAHLRALTELPGETGSCSGCDMGCGMAEQPNGPPPRLDWADLARLESLQADLGRWAESPASADVGGLLERARVELETVFRSMHRVELPRALESLARSARETAARHGKLARVDVYCADVAVPEHLITALSGPMVNVLNNAVEHGLESIEERQAAGKPALASIELRGSWADGWLTLEVVDDGRGIDRQAVLEAARRCGADVDVDAGRHVRALSLVLQPGVSTSSERDGLGLDAVRREVEAHEGVLEVTSMPGRETRVSLCVPERPVEKPASTPALAVVPEGDDEPLQLDGELNFL